jgi:hypothetical protein
LEAVNAATRGAAPDIRAQVHATAEAALEFLTADPRRGQLLLRSNTSEVLQRARLDSTRAISNAMSAMIRAPLGAAAGSQFDTDLAAFALVSGAMEVIAGWLRGDFDASQENLAGVVAGLLLAVADISTALPGSPSQPVHSGGVYLSRLGPATRDPIQSEAMGFRVASGASASQSPEPKPKRNRVRGLSAR